MQKFVGETALWMPKSGFPHTSFRESKESVKAIFFIIPFGINEEKIGSPRMILY